MFVLGVDPGVTRCGYAVVQQDGRATRAHAIGVLTTSRDEPLARRLADLQHDLRSLIAEFSPHVVAIERVLFTANTSTAMSVGQASGLAMAEAAVAGCEVIEYSPNQVKQAVAGHGGASKRQVQEMVQVLLGLDTVPNPPDAADAAALALCHLAMAPLHAAAARATTSARGTTSRQVSAP